MTQQYMVEKITINEQIAEMNETMQQVVTDRNTLKNALGTEKAELLLRESGYYEEPGESDCASSTKNDDSDDESMADRFRNLAIPPSMKSLGKRKEVEEPIEKIIGTKTGSSLKDSMHATKKIDKHEGKQSYHKHVLGVNCASSGVNKEE
ncbi:hypothetical protein C1645_737510 [Glomus cerebriforme]|uniref:Uncharacterized protein n=1 Tax=Glomus cerebriforme TaxID=658196 RepID=A0A397T0S5_9GLOM|nr:hypothetical protein C1645_737510 [Glomus cerebriforme]